MILAGLATYIAVVSAGGHHCAGGNQPAPQQQRRCFSGIALTNAYTVRQAQQVPEVPATEQWGTEYQALFSHGRDQPVLVNAYVFYPTYTNRLPHSVW